MTDKIRHEDFKEALHNWAKWWDEHYLTIPKDNLAKRLDFLETAMQGMMELHAHRYREDEQRRQSSTLWLPR